MFGIVKCDSKQLRKISNFEHDIKLVYDHHRWFIHVPIAYKETFDEPLHDCCAIDPGIRNFVTTYDGSASIKISPRKDILSKLYTRMDKLRSLRSKKLISVDAFQGKYYKLSNRLTGLIDEMQFKTRNFLLRSYKKIILPPFESQRMASKRISSSVNRLMMSLRHYQFQTRIKESVSKHTIVTLNEAYTSKTCTCCGNINSNLGASDVYSCNVCNTVIDRDVNGARNIYLKYLITTK